MHPHQLREYTGVQPTTVSKGHRPRQHCRAEDPIALVKAVGVGETDIAETEKVGDHSHDGHGHKATARAMVVLKNVKRWITGRTSKLIHPTLYEILLSAMRTDFIHKREGKTLSANAFSRLNACLGIGFDMNNEDMDAITKMDSWSTPAVALLFALPRRQSTTCQRLPRVTR